MVVEVVVIIAKGVVNVITAITYLEPFDIAKVVITKKWKKTIFTNLADNCVMEVQNHLSKVYFKASVCNQLRNFEEYLVVK